MLVQKEVENMYIGGSSQTILFDFWDWTNTSWLRNGTQWPEWTVTKSVDQITFYNSGFCRNYMETYIIDWTKDFLLEMNADIPNTTQSNHRLGLRCKTSENAIKFETSWETNYRNKMWCCPDDPFWTTSHYYAWETNPWRADYFIKKEWNVLTMWRGGATKYTDNNYTFEESYYLIEGVYNKTLTIYTAKLTYL